MLQPAAQHLELLEIVVNTTIILCFGVSLLLIRYAEVQAKFVFARALLQARKGENMSALNVEIMAICAAFAVMAGVLIAVW